MIEIGLTLVLFLVSRSVEARGGGKGAFLIKNR